MPTLPLASAESFLLTYALNALWQVPLLFAAAWLASRTARRAGPAFQHALWTTALFAEILLPALSATPADLLQSAQTWLASLRHAVPAIGPTVTITMGEAHAATGFQIPPILLAAAAILYLAALAFFATRLAIGLHKTSSLRRRAQPLTLTGYAHQSYNRCANLFAVPHAQVATSPEIASPITLGIRRPTLLLPAQLDTLLDEDLDAAIAHEFAHIRRRDFAKNLFYEILSLPIAFHPILWLTRRRMSETRELVCDAMAANAVAGPQRYARSLLRLATQFAQSTNAPTPHAIGIFDANPFKNFERRVMNLTHRPIQLRGAARLIPAALSLILIGSACTTALAFRQQVATPPAQTQTETQTTPPPPQTPTPTPKNFVLGIPRSADGTHPQTLKVNVADADGPNPIIKVLTPAGTSESSTIETVQSDPSATAHISPGVIAGQRLSFVNPVYPDVAKKAKLSGTVVLHALIGKDGKMEKLDVLTSSNPIFNNSAMEAVSKWTYRPYLLNGNPTAVDTSITINYSLNPDPARTPSPAPSPSASNPQPSAPSNQLMHVGGDVTQPVVISQGEPEYTRQARAAKLSGTVRVYLQVDPDGHTSHIRVVKGVGMGLDEKAVLAVSKYKFKPATLAGKPVPVDLYIDVNFQIL
jgi:TonB family protein